MKKVTILGGGFAGLEAAIYLKKYSFDVTLISDRDFLYIYPTSIWIPTGEASFEDNKLNLNELSDIHGFNLLVDKVTAVDAKQNSYTLEREGTKSDYDYLVVALGASKTPANGIENTLSICAEPKQSLALKDRLDALIEKGSGELCFGFGGNPKDMSAVRGGPAFELIFNVHNHLKKKGLRENFKLTFFAPMSEPGKKMGEKSLKMMDMFFKRLNINKHFGKKIKSFESESIIFEDDSKLNSDLTMFIAAGMGNTLLENSGLSLSDAGFVNIDNFCRAKLDNGELSDNIFAIGDVAALEGYDWRAKQGHIAEVMARNTAHNIMQIENNQNNLEGYQEHINILCVMDTGDGAAFVYRDSKKSIMLPMPIVGHWLKKGWGLYYKLSKKNKIPRLPFM